MLQQHPGCSCIALLNKGGPSLPMWPHLMCARLCLALCACPLPLSRTDVPSPLPNIPCSATGASTDSSRRRSSLWTKRCSGEQNTQGWLLDLC